MVAKLIGSAVEYLLGGPTVGGASEVRLRRWQALPEAQLTLPHAHARYVVVDTEAPGSGARDDGQLAIGAAAVTKTQLDLADCFATVLRRQRAGARSDPSTESGRQAQGAGIEPALGMLDFLEYLGRAPLVAFEGRLRRAEIERAVKSALGVPFQHPWIDLTGLMTSLFPQDSCATRQAWLERFGLAAGAWPGALGNAFATAQMLQIVLAAADRAGLTCAAHLMASRSGQD